MASANQNCSGVNVNCHKNIMNCYHNNYNIIVISTVTDAIVTTILVCCDFINNYFAEVAKLFSPCKNAPWERW